MPSTNIDKAKALIKQAQTVLTAIGMPPRQQTERTARTLLALLHVSPDLPWAQASSTAMGIDQIRQYIT